MYSSLQYQLLYELKSSRTCWDLENIWRELYSSFFIEILFLEELASYCLSKHYPEKKFSLAICKKKKILSEFKCWVFAVYMAINETGRKFSPLHDISLFDSREQNPGYCTNLFLLAKTPIWSHTSICYLRCMIYHCLREAQMRNFLLVNLCQFLLNNYMEVEFSSGNRIKQQLFSCLCALCKCLGHWFSLHLANTAN